MPKPPTTTVSILDLFGGLEDPPEQNPDTKSIHAEESVLRRPFYIHDISPSEYTLDCGHEVVFSSEETLKAQQEGFCCGAGKKGILVTWTRLRGTYLRPLPESVRRTREHSQGFPGYCCDAQGWYIGGIGNNCTYYRPEGAPLCSAHGTVSIPQEVLTAIPEEQDLNPTEPVKKSFKQRQMEARQKSKSQS